VTPTTPAPTPTPPPGPSSPTPTSTPAPAPAPTTPLANPRLTLAAPTVARDRRTITVRGTVAPGVAGAVTVSVTAKIRGRTRTVTRRATIRNRGYAARLRLPSSAWRSATITVRLPVGAGHRAARITRKALQRRR
jgi:hypothetical protein